MEDPRDAPAPQPLTDLPYVVSPRTYISAPVAASIRAATVAASARSSSGNWRATWGEDRV